MKRKRPVGGGGGGGGGGGSRPVAEEPTPEDCERLPTEELIAKALSYHGGMAFRTGVKSRSGRFRREREEAAAAHLRHEKIARVLKLSDEAFSRDVKRLFITCIHHPDPKIRSFMASHIPPLRAVLEEGDIASLARQLVRVTTFGLPDEIDLPYPTDLQPSEQDQVRQFFQRLSTGETAIAVLNSADLPQDATGSIAVLEIPDLDLEEGHPLRKGIQEVGPHVIASAISYASALGDVLQIINIIRRNVHELDHFISLLERALETLAFPIVAEVLPEQLEAIADPGLRDDVDRSLAQGTVTVDRQFVETIHRFSSDLVGGTELRHTTGLFPVILEVPARSEVVDGKIALDKVQSLRVYCRPADLPQVQGWAERTGISQRTSLSPFLPPPETGLLAMRGVIAYPLGVSFAILGLRNRVVEFSLAKLESDGGPLLESYPKARVENTRKIFSHPEKAIHEGRAHLLAAIAEARKRTLTPSEVRGNHLITGIADILGDRLVPTEVRASLRDMFSRVEPHLIEAFVEIVAFYRQTPSPDQIERHRRLLGRMILQVYLHHYPWAEEIVIEEHFKRESLFGNALKRPPLGVAEISTEDRPLANRFAYVATRLALLPEEQVRRFIEVVSQMPDSPTVQLRHRNWERLRDLSAFEHREAFEFIGRFRGIFFDPRLINFLVNLRPKSGDEGQKRFRTAIASHSAHYLAEVQEATETLNTTLERIAGDDPALRMELLETVSLLTYRVASHLSAEATVKILKNLASNIKALSYLGPPRPDDEQLMTDLRGLIQPHRLAAIMDLLGQELTSEGDLKELLAEFLDRQAANFHAIQYLLLALHVFHSGSIPRDWLIQIFQREKRISETVNPAGKVWNDTFFREALFEILSSHFKQSRFGRHQEARIIREFAARGDVVGVEVLLEDWNLPTPDLRIYPVEGPPYLVEIKTLVTTPLSTAELESQFERSLQTAIGQLQTQQGMSRERGNRIVFVLGRPLDQPLAPELLARLRERAQLLTARFSRIAGVDIQEREADY